MDSWNRNDGDERAHACAGPSTGTIALSTWSLYRRRYQPDGRDFRGLCARPGADVVFLLGGEGL